MQRVSTTVIALVGGAARDCASELARAANLRAVLPDAAAEPLDRAVQAWREAKSAHIPYLVHDADPLTVVAASWVDWFTQRAPVGTVEVAVQQTIARWRAQSIEVPDYYLVLDPESLDETWRHWYLGFLHRAAPHRVVPVQAAPAAVAARIAHLPAGRWWPDLDRLLDGVERVVPDRA
ncbi:MAG: hypothetical protein H0V05_14300 [Euzebyaceae bacterium]|jgi:hypothetical protein|nr:hypothetical protein [Euzebyaceae bacterium]